MVRRLQRRGQPRALGRHRMVPDLRDAQLGEDARATASRRRRSTTPDLVTLGAGAFPQRLRLLSWRAGHPDQPDRAGACCRRRRILRRRCGRGATASCSGSSRTASSTPACRPGRRSSATTRSGRWSRSCGGCPRSTPQQLPRPRARRPAECRRRAGASSRPARPTSAARRRLRALSRRRAQCGRPARWCRSCTGSRRNFSPRRCEAYAGGAARQRHHAAGRARPRAARTSIVWRDYYAGFGRRRGREPADGCRRDRARTRLAERRRPGRENSGLHGLPWRGRA